MVSPPASLPLTPFPAHRPRHSVDCPPPRTPAGWGSACAHAACEGASPPLSDPRAEPRAPAFSPRAGSCSPRASRSGLFLSKQERERHGQGYLVFLKQDGVEPASPHFPLSEFIIPSLFLLSIASAGNAFRAHAYPTYALSTVTGAINCLPGRQKRPLRQPRHGIAAAKD